jgi:hypothetical protein
MPADRGHPESPLLRLTHYAGAATGLELVIRHYFNRLANTDDHSGEH